MASSFFSQPSSAPEMSSTDRIVQFTLPSHRGARLCNRRRVRFYRRLTSINRYFDLSEGEAWWAARYEAFFSRGYQLRHRYSPGWKPSWIGTNISPFACDDAYRTVNTRIIDAKRLGDNSSIIIKRVPASSNELRIAEMLSTPERRCDSANHCAPLLDKFTDLVDNNIGFIVMPLYRKFNDPPFYYVEEVVDFFTQTLEGLVYMHNLGVAHRDLADLNIMMEADCLFPDGFHPVWQERSGRFVEKKVKPLCRADAGPVKYVFIDFGLSTYFEDPNGDHLVTGFDGLNEDVPELNNFGIQYDAYCVDVFTLGRVFQSVISDFRNMDFLSPLVKAMTRSDPKLRPTSKEAKFWLEKEILRQQPIDLRWRLQPRQEHSIVKGWREFSCGVREVKQILRAGVARLISNAARMLSRRRTEGYEPIQPNAA